MARVIGARCRPLAAALAVLVVGLPAAAQELPALTAPVNDFAGVIDATSAAELDKRIRALHTSTGDVIVVATVDSFAPYGSIEEYAVRLFERAGIGDKEQDRGALILLAVNDRAVRIEVGYGLEEFITDGFAGDTIRQQMLPEFREKRFGAGLLAGATRLIQRLAERRGVTLSDVPPPAPARPQRTSGEVLVGIAVLIVALMVVGRMIDRFGPRGPHLGGRRRRSTWSGWHGGIGGFGGGGFGGGFGGFGGGGGGGFGGFGGGMSGGGGASGRF